MLHLVFPVLPLILLSYVRIISWMPLDTGHYNQNRTPVFKTIYLEVQYDVESNRCCCTKSVQYFGTNMYDSDQHHCHFIKVWRNFFRERVLSFIPVSHTYSVSAQQQF